MEAKTHDCANNEDDKVGANSNPQSGAISRCVLRAEDCRCDDATNTTSSDDQCRGESSLGLSNDVVLHVSEDTGHVGVGTSKTEEHTSVPDTDRGMECGHAQTDDGDDGLEHDDGCTDNVLVAEPCEAERNEDGRKVRRRNEQLGIEFTESHSGENDGQEVSKRIGAGSGRAEDKSESPELWGSAV